MDTTDFIYVIGLVFVGGVTYVLTERRKLLKGLHGLWNPPPPKKYRRALKVKGDDLYIVEEEITEDK